MVFWKIILCFCCFLLSNVRLVTSENCPDPPILVNGHTTTSDGVYAVYECDAGYEMDIEQDTVVLVCDTSQGTWNQNLPNCDLVQCPEPAVPNFGQVEGSGRSFGDNITLSCDGNYCLVDPEVMSCVDSDSLTITCTHSGHWSQETPECIPDINDPDICPAGSWAYEAGNTCFLTFTGEQDWWNARGACASDSHPGQLAKIPDQATQEFLEGKLQGQTTSFWIAAFKGLKWYWEESDTEMDYFSWDNGEPNGARDSKVCIQLSGFNSPTSGFHSYNWNDEDCTKVSYTEGNKQNFFVCEFENQCPSDAELDSYTQTSYGANCVVFVKQAKNWDDSNAYCKAKSGKLVEVHTEVHQDILVQTANNENVENLYHNWWIGGFRDDSKTNNQILWLDAGPRGPIQCSDPGEPAHGTYNTSHPDWLFGSYVTFSCDVGYELDGGDRIDCRQNGTYSGPRPECKPVSCDSSHPTLPNSNPSNTSSEYRSVVVYMCQEFYQPVGDVTSVCQADGTWSQPTGTCEADNSTIPTSNPETDSPTTLSSVTSDPMGTDNPSTASSGTGYPTTFPSGTGTDDSTAPPGTDFPTTPLSATDDPTTPPGTDHTTTSPSGTDNPTTALSGTDHSTTPPSGSGFPTNPTSETGISITPTERTGNSTDPSFETTQLAEDQITLQCGPFSMTVTVPVSRLGEVTSGEDLYLLRDDNCTGTISADMHFISITTNLTDCNNEVTENDEDIVYSNTVVSRESSGKVITRIKMVSIPFFCSYNRSEEVGLLSYRVTNYRLNLTEDSTGQYDFSLDIFKDSGFLEKYADSEYPVDVELNEDLYFGASVPSQDGSLDLAIKGCVATPSASYNDKQWTIIGEDGCAYESTTQIDDDRLAFVAVTMNTFRFVELGNRVYIHCDLLVCQATTGSDISECDPSCSETFGNRNRRDTIKKYSLDKKRVTKGPLRLRRNSHFNPLKYDKIETKGKSALYQNIDPWIILTVTMATICIFVVAVLFVVLHKMSVYARRTKVDGSYDQTREALLKS
ncbi:sushi, von Willebrand factor type A, EGF and pentraxin domain-containing protein 1-like isoform X2 [Lytechinus variegatus]|uniref:sushi, von Willebrand factor type A, EGF and pentraxin domain-containing protein 1-like isoform X2 n=1 Tax=Lytechinus variegatus TaxID=7654 RepID=UPI001BB264C8|nr:sushi, von Willebrand factor type A, EGF and pentraxin domain-containing protein 1-like isoform X2 [Lytechinus variegatus]